MVVLELFGALIVMFVLWCHDERKTAVTRYKSGMSVFPTGYAIEYKTIVDVYNRVYSQYAAILRKDGYRSAADWVEKTYGQYKLGGENDVMLCYAIVQGRASAIKNNRSPACYNGLSDGSINESGVQYGYKKYRADIDSSKLRICTDFSKPLVFDRKNYERLLEIDKKSYNDAVEVRKMAGCWTGSFERRFSL